MKALGKAPPTPKDVNYNYHELIPTVTSEHYRTALLEAADEMWKFCGDRCGGECYACEVKRKILISAGEVED